VSARRLAAVLAGLVLLVTTGCSGPAPAPPAAAAAAAAGVLGFTGETIDGEPFDAATMAGKPALLWFWAPWCATCASQAGSVTSMQEEYGDRLGILGIAGMGDNKDMHEFVSDLEVGGIRHLDDQAGVVWRKFGITEQSTYVLVDAAGQAVATSYLDDQQLGAEVDALVS